MAQHPDIGHVHLKVSDLERAVAFYRDVLGMDVQQRYGAAADVPGQPGVQVHPGALKGPRTGWAGIYT